MSSSAHPRPSSDDPSPGAARLDGNERGQLLRAARGSIALAIATGRAPPPESLGVPSTALLAEPRATFVTLRSADRRLRGCIGEILPDRPLLESVIRNAVRAALNDPRFPEVDASELPGLSLEISVLTPPARIESPDQIVVGRHGVLLEARKGRAVFLPQVAVEQGWDLEQLLGQLALKAGLDRNAWRSGARLSVFEAEKFGETDVV